MDSITIKDVARICGVGVSTVSRAINNHPDINEETKNMILQVIKENNYIPNNSARNLKRSVSRVIVLLVKGIDNEGEKAQGNYLSGRLFFSWQREAEAARYPLCIVYSWDYG